MQLWIRQSGFVSTEAASAIDVSVELHYPSTHIRGSEGVQHGRQGKGTKKQ